MKLNKTVLVVDDTSMNLALMTAILRNNYQVKVAKSGAKALELVASEPPDLVLLDVVMPGLSGFDVCERLKSEPATRDIPVIFVSGLQGEDERAHGLRLGAVGFIGKPFDTDGVLAAVDAILLAGPGK